MTPAQAGLINKAQQSLQAAKLLNQNGFYDFAASRAYYTMFYVAEAFLEGEGLSYKKHSAVIAKFGELFVRSGRVPIEFHRTLIQAERERNQADYNIGPGLLESEVQEQITNAERFMEVGNRLIVKLHYQKFYEQYTQRVTATGSQQQVDYQIALSAFRDGLSYQDVAYVLAQSPQCQRLKSDITRAKEYVEDILQQAQPEVQRSQNSDFDFDL